MILFEFSCSVELKPDTETRQANKRPPGPHLQAPQARRSNVDSPVAARRSVSRKCSQPAAKPGHPPTHPLGRAREHEIQGSELSHSPNAWPMLHSRRRPSLLPERRQRADFINEHCATGHVMSHTPLENTSQQKLFEKQPPFENTSQKYPEDLIIRNT